MKILILGGTGMLGSEVIKQCISRKLDWHTTIREKDKLYKSFGANILNKYSLISDAKEFSEFETVIKNYQPDVTINCIGIVKQSDLSKNYIESISINSLLPHKLNEYCFKNNSKLIHISTDCVFDGKKGMYSESDTPNADDLYGKSKQLGEVDYGCALTLRTSIIGHELQSSGFGLLSWVLSQTGTIKGFTNAFFSGFTTFELTKIILDYVIPKNINPGIYNVASNPISKFELLGLINETYNLNLKIIADSDYKIDRTLNAQLFNKITDYHVPNWSFMINEMKHKQ